MKVGVNIALNNARTLRKNLTAAEQALWSHLRFKQMGRCKFRRQQPIGPYIVDFVCLEKKVVVEVDGGQHSEQKSDDEGRTRWLESQGFRVLRFWNNQVLEEIDTVKEALWQELMTN